MATLPLQYNSKNRHFGLDLIRAMAIILVLLHHGVFFPSSFHPSLHTFSFFGVLGVELFFVLSGYLIGTILLRTYYRETHFNFLTLSHFWKRRWFRTLPAYFIVLLLCLLIYPMLNAEQYDIPYHLYFSFLQNFNTSIPPFFMESWSLSIEEWFYIVLPLLFLILSFSFTRKVSPARLALILGIWVLIATIIRYWLISTASLTNWNMQIRQVVLMRLDAAAFGVFLACLHLAWPAKLIQRSKLLAVCGLFGMIFSAAIYVLFIQDIMHHAVFATLYSSLLSTSILCLFPVILKWKNCTSIYLRKLITRLSKVSYAVYLINYSLILLPMNKLVVASSGFEAWFYALAFWVISLTFANLFYTYIERPLTDLRDRF